MDVAKVHGIFIQWIEVLDGQGVRARFSNTFAAEPEGLSLVAVLSTARLDPERRVQVAGRLQARDRPLARLQYIIALEGAVGAQQAEQVLVSLLLEADRHPEVQALTDPVSDSWWLAQGVVPRPAFRCEVSVTERVEPSDATLVRDVAIAVDSFAIVRGRVVWPDGRPVGDAQVHIPACGQRIATDRSGAFQLGLMADPDGKDAVSVRVGQQVKRFTVQDIVTADGQWLLRMDEPT